MPCWVFDLFRNWDWNLSMVSWVFGSCSRDRAMPSFPRLYWVTVDGFGFSFLCYFSRFLVRLQLPSMSLACLVCHGAESPSHSFRSYSVSSSENDGRCSAIANCLAMKPSLPLPPTRSAISTSKVTPQPNMPAGITGTPRLVRSHAVRRDIVRDWNFDEVVTRMER
ncbi:uncharacterized protein LOC115681604 isoform X2 [Syzygium oleosum]|uniref:uncharacterized protein LOC115681604 isoform X2 n=1 Tax=Syzygium oleosum TaxID=219896 RepID=UPI0024B9E578|nr:uncharacterized protein LOC115681604 isoform X2 [Syzygium oleosum]